MNSADETHSARRKGRLIAAEKCGGASQGNGEFIRVHHGAEIAYGRGWSTGFAKNG
jgi:hypothetical protein